MSRKDVERFVGLLVSDEEFVRCAADEFEEAMKAYEIDLEDAEKALLKEGLLHYVPKENQVITPGGAVMAVGAAVGAAVAASVAGNVATKAVDKLTDSKIATPLNMRIRDSLVLRRVIDESALQQEHHRRY